MGVFLLFPIILNYFSPAIIMESSSQGIVNGSMLVFALLFLGSLVFGRAWCGWVCPAGGLQEALFAAQDRPARGGRLDWIKWAIWIPWIGAIVAFAATAGGYHRVDPFYLTEQIVTLVEPVNYIIYYTVVGLMVGLSLTAGRRGFCHYVCWMAPFMILGRRLRNLVRWPALRLQARPADCTQCHSCSQKCPMSLDVTGLVARGTMEHDECILCGACVDTCPRSVIRYSFSGGTGGEEATGK